MQKIYLSGMLAFFTLILISCSSSDKMTSGIIQKRVHTKGYHISIPSGAFSLKKNKKQFSKRAETASTDMSSPDQPGKEKVEKIFTSGSKVTAMEEYEKPEPVYSEKVPQKSAAPLAENNPAADKPLNKYKKAIQSIKPDRIAEKAYRPAGHNSTASYADPPPDDMFIIQVVLAFLIPPLAVFLKEDAITNNFWINLILTLLFWVPGVIHALLIVLEVI